MKLSDHAKFLSNKKELDIRIEKYELNWHGT